MKPYKCEFCGEKVFKEYERGIVIVKELRKIEGNYHESISHSCLFVGQEKAE